MKQSAFNPISVKITFSLNSSNVLIHYLAGNFCIIMKGHRAIGNWVLLPMACWRICASSEFVDESSLNPGSKTCHLASWEDQQGAAAGGASFFPLSHLEEILFEFGCFHPTSHHTDGGRSCACTLDPSPVPAREPVYARVSARPTSIRLLCLTPSFLLVHLQGPRLGEG